MKNNHQLNNDYSGIVQPTIPFCLNSLIGNLSLYYDNLFLTRITFSENNSKPSIPFSDFLQNIQLQFNNYFINPFFEFDIPIKLVGTVFQKKVWEALQTIPTGETKSYGELAKQLHTSPRAIGNACRANPIPIIVPCHRAVSQNGLGGYAGQTSGRLFDIKTWLLHHEMQDQ